MSTLGQQAYTPREMIEKLISFDTISKNSNLALIHFVQSYLQSYGIESHLVHNEEGSKANLYATIGPMVEGGVVLSGHTDVVPVEGQPWDTDPFTVVEKEGRLYGRGTCDMKSFIAIGLAMVPQMLEKDMHKPIHFAFSYDEEIGCIGAPYMIEQMAKVLPKPIAVIVGEPTSMRVIKAHKGISSFVTTVVGSEAHSSQVNKGVSAVTIAAKLITFLDSLMQDNAAKADSSSAFVPPYSTIHVGIVNGGTAVNIISRLCEFSWEVRPIPGDSADQFQAKLEQYCEILIKEMQLISPLCDITTEVESCAPPLRIEENSSAAKLCKELCGTEKEGVVSYATEAGQFQSFEFSTVVCGPGSIDQAHKPNEFIELSEVQACEEFMEKLIDKLS